MNTMSNFEKAIAIGGGILGTLMTLLLGLIAIQMWFVDSDKADLESVSTRLDGQISRIDGAFSDIGNIKENVAITRALAEQSAKVLDEFRSDTKAQFGEFHQTIDGLAQLTKAGFDTNEKRFQALESSLTQINAKLPPADGKQPIMFEVKDGEKLWHYLQTIDFQGPVYIGVDDPDVRAALQKAKEQQQ